MHLLRNLTSFLFFAMALAKRAGITFEEYRECSELAFEWALSYDTKNWTHLETLLLPELYIDYTAVLGPGNEFPNITAAAFIAQVSGQDQLGFPLVATQHFFGGSSWQRTSENKISAKHQLRAVHLRYADDGSGNRSSKVLMTATGNGFVNHFYGKNERGEWKLAGIQPSVLFFEGNLSAIFDPALH